MLFYTAITSCHSLWSLMRVHNFADAHYGPVVSTCWGLRSEVRAKVTACVACVWNSLHCISTPFGCCKCDGPQQINQLWGFIRYIQYIQYTYRQVVLGEKKYFHTLDNSGTDTMGTTYGYIWLSQRHLTLLQFVLFYFLFFFSKHHWFSFDQHFLLPLPMMYLYNRCTVGALIW